MRIAPCAIFFGILFSFTELRADPDIPHRVEISPAPAAPALFFKGTYKVGEFDTLGEISMRLYGTCHLWKKIAAWNQIQAPYQLKPGQTLNLVSPPAVSASEGDRRLLAMWEHRFGLDAERDASRQQDLKRSLASYETSNDSGKTHVLVDEPTHHAEIVEISSE